MEAMSKEERKMAELAVYAIDTYGTTSGVTKYNSVCSDLCCAKTKALEVLKDAVDNI